MLREAPATDLPPAGPGDAERRLRRRLGLLRAAERALGLSAAASLGAATAIASGRPPLGVLVAVALGAWAVVGTTARRTIRRLEQRDRALDGAVAAFGEGGGGRLREPLAAWVLARRPRLSGRRVAFLLGISAVALLLAPRLPRALDGARQRIASSGTAPAPPPAAAYLRVAVDVTPPAYTGRPPLHVDGAARPIPALAGSIARIAIETSATSEAAVTSITSITVTEEGREARKVPVEAHRATYTATLVKPTALRIGPDLVVVFDVVPDRPPDLELTLPREDRTVTAAPGPVDVSARARDDVGLTSFAFRYTLAHGHGEGMTFKSGRVEGGPVSGTTASATTHLETGSLGFGPGDTLVVWAEATDGNGLDGPARTASSVRIVRWEEDLARIEMKSSAPAVRPLDGPLSQREILARTVRLLGERLPNARLRERSLELAAEQGKLRDAFGFFLRAERGDAVELDVETKESAELGSDRARRLLAEAVSAMWASEGELSAANPRGSLPHQRLALKRLDEAFGNERYALRALAPPKAPVDEGRRLKGDAKGMRARTAPEPPRGDPDPYGLGPLARRLLLLAEGMGDAPARALADRLWALPDAAGVPRATLAAPLYAARTEEETARAARAAADALLRALDPAPLARPPVSPDEARLVGRLDATR